MGKETLQRINLRQLLHEKTEWFENQLSFQSDLNPNDYCPTPAQSKVLSIIQEQSFRISDLARQIGISRQAIHKNVSDLVKAGIVELIPDQTCRNAKLVRMTKEGDAKLTRMTNKINGIEELLAEDIGHDRVQVLYEILGTGWSKKGLRKTDKEKSNVAILVPRPAYEILCRLKAHSGESISAVLYNAVLNFSKHITINKNAGKKVEGYLEKIRAQLKKVKEKHILDEEKTFNKQALYAIEKRAKANEEPMDREKTYHDVLDYSSDVIYRVNLNADKFEYVSPSSKKEWRLSPEEILSFDKGTRIVSSIHPEDRKKVKKHINDSILNSGKEKGLIEFRVKMEKGKGYRWLSQRHTVVFDENKKAIAIVANSRDITERKKEEEKLLELVDQLERKVKKYSVDLEETNAALRVLLKQNQKEKEEIEDRVLFNMKELVMPVVEKLKHCTLKDLKKCIDILEYNLDRITSSFSSKLTSKHLNLTHQEIQVANHILHGRITKEIAELMGLSIKTIDFHRAKIRRKMGLTNTKKSLRTHLLSLQ